MIMRVVMSLRLNFPILVYWAPGEPRNAARFKDVSLKQNNQDLHTHGLSWLIESRSETELSFNGKDIILIIKKFNITITKIVIKSW